MSDHLWFTLKREWLKIELVSGTVLSVTGKVQKYRRSNGSFDYGLTDTKNLTILKQGSGDIKPAKKWKHGSYSYYKFITNKGTRWYREKDNKKERVLYTHNKNGFDEKIIPMDIYDEPYINSI